MALPTDLRDWPVRRWIAALAAAAVTGTLTGVPTDLLDTGWFTRMTPVRWWDYPVWLAGAVLGGLALATYVRSPGPSGEQAIPASAGRTLGASTLTVFAVGCPVCNKLVVAVLGFSGAQTYFEPVQPLLAVASLILLASALVIRLRGERHCALPGVA